MYVGCDRELVRGLRQIPESRTLGAEGDTQLGVGPGVPHGLHAVRVFAVRGLVDDTAKIDALRAREDRLRYRSRGREAPRQLESVFLRSAQRSHRSQQTPLAVDSKAVFTLMYSHLVTEKLVVMFVSQLVPKRLRECRTPPPVRTPDCSRGRPHTKILEVSSTTLDGGIETIGNQIAHEIRLTSSSVLFPLAFGTNQDVE